MHKRVLCLLLPVILVIVLCAGCDGGAARSAKASCGELLSALRDAGWTHDSVGTKLGERDSYFDRYDVYFDEGVSVKFSEVTTQYYPDSVGYYVEPLGDVENLLFNSKYTGEIYGGVTMSSTKSQITRLLGEPDFTDSERKLFGYKTEDIYVFFIGDESVSEVSVWPIPSAKNPAVIDEAIELCRGRTVGDSAFANSLATLLSEGLNTNYIYMLDGSCRWTDRRSETGFACYAAGVVVDWQGDNVHEGATLRIYGNCEAYVENAGNDKCALIGYVSEDLVFEREKARIDTRDLAASEVAVSPNGNIKAYANYEFASPLLVGFDVVYTDGSRPNFTVTTPPACGKVAWLSDRYIIADYNKCSLMLFDTESGAERVLSNGLSYLEVDLSRNQFTVEDNVYGEESVIGFYFDGNGEIVLTGDALISGTENSDLLREFVEKLFKTDPSGYDLDALTDEQAFIIAVRMMYSCGEYKLADGVYTFDNGKIAEYVKAYCQKPGFDYVSEGDGFTYLPKENAYRSTLEFGLYKEEPENTVSVEMNSIYREDDDYTVTFFVNKVFTEAEYAEYNRTDEYRVTVDTEGKTPVITDVVKY